MTKKSEQIVSERSRDWSAALVQYAVAQRPANAELLKQLFGQAPRPLQPEAVAAAKVRAVHHALLARCGLNMVEI